MAPERVVVIGGTGFIGRHLVARLATEAVAVAVVSPERPTHALPKGVSWCAGDVRDARSLHAALVGATTVYHLASAHGLESQPRALFVAINVEGTRHVAEAAHTADVSHLIFASTARVYGSRDANPSEATTPAPANHYAETKLAAERVLEEWRYGRSGRRLTIVRPCVVIGPGAHATGGAFLRMIVAPGYAIEGDGRERKALAHVENLAAFLAFAGCRTASPWLFNYADQPDFELREIVAVAREAAGVRSAPHRERETGWMRSVGRALSRRSAAAVGAGMTRTFDVTRVRDAGFVAPVPLRDAIANTARSEFGWLRLIDQRRA